MKSRMFRKRNLRSKKNKTRKNRSRKNRKYQRGGEGHNLIFKVSGSGDGHNPSVLTRDRNIENFLNGRGDLITDQWLDSRSNFISLLKILRKIKQKIPLSSDEMDKIRKLINNFNNSSLFITEVGDNAKMLLIFDKMNKGEGLNSEESELKSRMSEDVNIKIHSRDIAKLF